MVRSPYQVEKVRQSGKMPIPHMPPPRPLPNRFVGVPNVDPPLVGPVPGLPAMPRATHRARR